MAIFAFAYVTTIPSWVNEKKVGVSVNKTVWWPATFGTMLKLVAGMLGSLAFRLVRNDGVSTSYQYETRQTVVAKC